MNAPTDLSLKQSLTQADQSYFNGVTAGEKRELADLSRSIPDTMDLLKDGSRSQVGAYQLASGREVVLKYYLPKNLIKKIRNRFTDTRCKRSWTAAHGLTHLKIPTPTPLFVAEHYRFGLLNSMSFLATDRSPGLPLDELSFARIKKLVPQFKLAFSKMMTFKIAHGDLKATNIIVSDTDKISFIDLDATRFQLNGAAWAKARRFDRERFLRNWKDAPKTIELLKPCFDLSHG